jgi:glycosyltransferase involved in cell wall biosynthesis
MSLLGKKTVFEDHEPPKSKRWVYKYLLKKIYKKVVVPYNLVKLYRQYGINDKSFIVAPNGVDLDEFNSVDPDRSVWSEFPELTSDDPIVLYIGHFYQWKGIYTLIDSARYMSGVKIVMIGGTDDDQKKVREYVEDKDLKNVLIGGFKKHKEIIKFIKSADVLVLPNTGKEERSEKYTTPIKLFEYMASGVPIVASRLESFKQYLKDDINCLMFEPDDARDLARVVSRFFSDDGLRKRLSNQAFDDVQDYTWEERARKIINFVNILK